jgi:hypothetical protein
VLEGSGKVGEPQRASVVVEAALPAVADGEAATDAELAGRLG